MRTSITLPDGSAEDADYLKNQRLAKELFEGYRAEAQEPSLDPEWSVVEVEGL